MKYNAVVDSEKRNMSPNDLLRNRRCVGIIQAKQRPTHGHVFWGLRYQRRRWSGLCPDVGGGGPAVCGRSRLNELSGGGGRFCGSREETRRRGSPCISATGRGEEHLQASVKTTQNPFPRGKASALARRRTSGVETAGGDSSAVGTWPGVFLVSFSSVRHHRVALTLRRCRVLGRSGGLPACLPFSPMNGTAPPQNEQYLEWASTVFTKRKRKKRTRSQQRNLATEVS
ncbi:unnamed protein product [Pleuronectes platessa]|uniref:Uncharacterized protein n=1 Tax=Pleuronectes platessa TaxID=8262 RepID=A0A9N7UG84_PLEPL|nr:unnamed protein product [Pleuronectes platessa]